MKKSPFFLIVVLMFLSLLSCDSEISHKEHVWGEQKVTKEATCTEEGEAIVSCSCGETKTVTLEKLGHDIKEFVTEPTPLQKGRIDYKCSRCGISGSEESVELDRSIAGYGMESYDEETGKYLYYKFEGNGLFFCFEYNLSMEVDAHILHAQRGFYSIIDGSDEKTYLVLPNFGNNYNYAFEITEENGTIITKHKRDLYNPPLVLELERNPNITDLPTQIVLNNGSNAQNIEDRSKYDKIDWDGLTTDSVCQYAYWDNDKIPNKTIFVSYSKHSDVPIDAKNNKCSLCGRIKAK